MPLYYDVEVSLPGIEPRIWRRFLIRRAATFLELHDAIRESGEWLNCHLFEFRSADGKVLAGLRDPESRSDTTPPAKDVKLRAHAGPGDSAFVYEYDFGDEWELDVIIHDEVRLNEKFKRRLLFGERAFPLEDAGGITGYEAMVTYVKTGKVVDRDPEFADRVGHWTPDHFDLGSRMAAFNR